MSSFLFEYRCTVCHRTVLSHTRDDSLGPCDPTLTTCPGRLKRVWSFAYHRGFVEHFNASVNRPVSSMRQFKDALSREGEKYSELTGLDVNYQPVDPTDTRALNITSEGLDSTNRQRVANGQAPVTPDG